MTVRVWEAPRVGHGFLVAIISLLFILPDPSLLPAATTDLEVSESTRVLEEEVRLSSRPQLYLLLDLPARLLFIKSHAMELFRLPVEAWSVSDERGIGRTFTLRTRPAVPRQKAVPGQDPTLEPIELRHMPMSYELLLDPNLTMFVTPSWRERPELWMRTFLQDWYQRIRHPNMIHLRLVLAPESARSLAWSVLEGMPLVIKRTEPNR